MTQEQAKNYIENHLWYGQLISQNDTQYSRYMSSGIPDRVRNGGYRGETIMKALSWHETIEGGEFWTHPYKDMAYDE